MLPSRGKRILTLLLAALCLAFLPLAGGCTSGQLSTAATDLHATAAAAAPIAAVIPTTQPASDKVVVAIDKLSTVSGQLGDAAQVLADSAAKTGQVDLADPNVQKAISGAFVSGAQAVAPSSVPQVASYSVAGGAVLGLLYALSKSHGTINALASSLGQTAT